ncbi:MAG: hypothetical protein CL933_05315 [Deltaproteobacteria bacterium]|nr:hypothetical protein [Deltaproteobacteria bacterium]
MNRAEIVSATRAGSALFEMGSRGLIEVRGEDRVRWLDGMISGDVEALAAGEPGSGCYATLLTSRGAIVADVHVAQMGKLFLLETLGKEIPNLLETLHRFIVADDVVLVDRSEERLVLGLEGPTSTAILAAAIDANTPVPTAENWREVTIADRDVCVGAFGFSGEAGYQLRLSHDDRADVEAALDGAAGARSIVRGDAEALETLRVEAGIPALGRELDREVLPQEARLEHAISTSKGCYVGQEIMARLRARGRVNHLLVGLKLETAEMPREGAELSAEGRRTGEITSLAESPTAGRIALAYVRREHAEPGNAVEFEAGRGEIVELPFVSSAGSPPNAREP